MIVIRNAQIAAMGGGRAQEFEAALVRKLHAPSNRWGSRDEWDLGIEVRAAIKEARALGFASEATVGKFVELRVGQRKAFDEELAKKTTQALLKSQKLIPETKIDLLERRMQPPPELKVRKRT